MKMIFIFCVFVLTAFIAMGQNSFIRFDNDQPDTISIQDFMKVKKLFVDIEWFKFQEYRLAYVESDTLKEIPVYSDTLPEVIKKELEKNIDTAFYRPIYIEKIKVEDPKGDIRKLSDHIFVIKY